MARSDLKFLDLSFNEFELDDLIAFSCTFFSFIRSVFHIFCSMSRNISFVMIAGCKNVVDLVCLRENYVMSMESFFNFIPRAVNHKQSPGKIRLSVESAVKNRCCFIGGPDFREQFEHVQVFVDFCEPEEASDNEESDQEEDADDSVTE